MKKIFLLLIISVGILSCEKNPDDYIENQKQLLLKDMNPYKGTKETIVTIIGEGFNLDISLNKVTLNDKICPIISVDSKQIVFSIPENANSGNIVVDSGNLTSELPYFTFMHTINEEVIVASSAQGINKPYGMVKDNLNNLYILDNSNHQIKKISTSNQISIFAGSSVGDGDKFKFPEGIAIDKNNNIYVSDTYNHKIKKIDQQGNVITIAGSEYGDGINFKYPRALTVDTNGNIFVVDSGNNKIKKISSTGLVSTFSSLNSSDLTNYIAIEGITIDSSNNLYVTFGSKIIKIDPTGNKSDYHTITGNNSFLSGSLITIDSQNNLYFFDRSKNVCKLEPNKETSLIVRHDLTRFNFSAKAILVDNNGFFYYSILHNNTIYKSLIN